MCACSAEAGPQAFEEARPDVGHRAQGTGHRAIAVCAVAGGLAGLVLYRGLESSGRGTDWIGRARTGETETRLGTLVRMEDVLLREVELDEC